MLRIVSCILIIIVVSPWTHPSQCTFAQFEDRIAPWRLEPRGDVDLSVQLTVPPDSALARQLQVMLEISAAEANFLLTVYRNNLGMGRVLDSLGVRNLDSTDLEALIPPPPARRCDFTSRYQQDIPPRSDLVRRSPYRWGNKIALTGASGIRLGAAFEKDPGESEPWDHVAVSLEVPVALGARVILGNFLVREGHGLIINTRRNFGLGSAPASALFFPENPLHSYASWDENIALLGGAASLDYGKTGLQFWASQRSRDAYLDEEGIVTSFAESGLHRSETESSHRDACTETALGFALQGKDIISGLSLGITTNAVAWDPPVYFGSEPVSSSWASGLQARYRFSADILTLETAWDNQGHSAGMGSFRARRGKTRLDLALYRVHPDYIAPLASSLDFDLGEVRNREGGYVRFGVTVQRFDCSGFAHIYRYPRRVPEGPRGGEDLGLQLRGSWRENIVSSVISRWTREDEGGNYSRNWRGKMRLRFSPDRSCSFYASLQATTSPEVSGWGKLMRLRFRREAKIGGIGDVESDLAAGIYRASDYSLRLYWYDADFSRSVRFLPLWGDGIVLQAGLDARTFGWGRIGVRFYCDLPEAGSPGTVSRTVTLVYRFY